MKVLEKKVLLKSEMDNVYNAAFCHNVIIHIKKEGACICPRRQEKRMRSRSSLR